MRNVTRTLPDLVRGKTHLKLVRFLSNLVLYLARERKEIVLYLASTTAGQEGKREERKGKKRRKESERREEMEQEKKEGKGRRMGRNKKHCGGSGFECDILLL